MDIAERLNRFLQAFTSTPSTTVAVVLGVIAFALIYFTLFRFLFKNNAGFIVWIFVAFAVVVALICILVTGADGVLFLILPALFILIVLILFRVEIGRYVWIKRTNNSLDTKHGESIAHDQETVSHCIDEIIKALQNMSKNDVGAIIVLSTGNVPTQVLDSGVKIESDISSQLIESVFFPKTPLHDGAMIISDTKIVAAGCFLPLSHNIDGISKDLGTRHRAGIGITETTDVISLIVSEETGIISIAVAGKITRYADAEALKKVLSRYYWQDLGNSRK